MKYTIVMIMSLTLFLSGCSDPKSVEEGQKFGKGKSVVECNNRAMEMIIECNVTACDIKPEDFAKGCAMMSSYEKTYCETMPLQSAFQTVKWVEEQCASHKDPKACNDVLKHAAGRCIAGKPEIVKTKSEGASEEAPPTR